MGGPGEQQGRWDPHFLRACSLRLFCCQAFLGAHFRGQSQADRLREGQAGRIDRLAGVGLAHGPRSGSLPSRKACLASPSTWPEGTCSCCAPARGCPVCCQIRWLLQLRSVMWRGECAACHGRPGPAAEPEGATQSFCPEAPPRSQESGRESPAIAALDRSVLRPIKGRSLNGHTHYGLYATSGF